MRPLQTDLSIYNQFNFEQPPVGIKFLFSKPEGMEQLDKKNLNLCDVLREAHQSGKSFYIDKENICCGEKSLGMREQTSPFRKSGEMGVKLDIFQEARANRRIYDYQPAFEPGIINDVVFSPLDKITFEPDLLILMATVSQAEIVLRAMSYSTGEIWSSKTTIFGTCAWLFVYPYQSGKVNYTVTGMGFGMKAKQVFPEGWILISIPYDWIPTITQNLKEMKWVLPAYTAGRDKVMELEKRITEELLGQSQNY
ncbi:DUF169 domain-containing protein [Chloroflexota bacterium]